MERVVYLVQVVCSNGPDIGEPDYGWTESHKLFQDIKYAEEYAQGLRVEAKNDWTGAIYYKVEIQKLVMQEVDCGLQSLRFDQ